MDSHSSARDFDFLIGTWTIANRRLRQRFAGSVDWDEFAASCRFQQLLGGIVNIDENHFPSRDFSGMSLRLFDVALGRWSIYWVNSRTGVLYPPVVGGFTGDHGEFVGEDVDDGHQVQVKLTWRRGPGAPRWSQAFSRDGRTWETNWTMDFVRA